MDAARRTNGHVDNGVSSHSRIPTVDEALPFSPLTSIVPFNSGKSHAVKA